MVWLLASTNWAALPATVDACSAFLAISPMLAVISSVAEATVLTLVVICSVAAAMLPILADISSAAEATVADWVVVSSAPPANCVAVADSSVDDPARVDAPLAIFCNMSARLAVMSFRALPKSPVSSF